MIKFAMFIVRLFKSPIQWLGVDFPQFRILLQTKLTMDFRNSSSAFQSPGSKKRTFLSQLIIFTLYGFLFGVVSFSIGDIMMSLSILFTVIMVTLAMTLISEFTTVLFDHRDNHILLPRPISPRTLLLLRLVHIQFYIGFISLSLAIVPGIMLAFKYNGVAVLIYFIAVGLCTWLTLIFTTFIYLLISKTVEGERFKDIITYVQVILAILIFAGYQLMPRLMDADVFSKASMSIQWWTYMFPPAWFAALIKLSLFTGSSTPVLLLSSMAVAIPVSGAVVLIRFLSKGFGNILSEESSESVIQVTRKTTTEKKMNKISRFFCISDIESAGWNLAVSTTRRDRKFKQSVYPYLGIMVVFAIVILKPDLNNLAGSLKELNDLSRYLFIIIVGFSGSVAVSQLPYTDTPEAAWIYRALPLKRHGHLLTGAIKAMLARFFLPVYLLVTIPALWLWGINIFPQILLGGLGIILLILITILLQKMELPFTQLREMQQKGINSIMAVFSMILMGIIAGLVYLTSLISAWITFLICGIVAGLIVLSFRSIRNKQYRIV
jgi:ABC-2 type transport system permease protein